MKKAALLLFFVLTACQVAVISASEDEITYGHVGTSLSATGTQANEHCAQFGDKKAVLAVTNTEQTVSTFKCVDKN